MTDPTIPVAAAAVDDAVAALAVHLSVFLEAGGAPAAAWTTIHAALARAHPIMLSTMTTTPISHPSVHARTLAQVVGG